MITRGRCGPIDWPCVQFMPWDQMTRHLDDYLCSAEVRGSFQETAPRKTAENTVKHHDGGVGSVVASHRDGGESSVVVTTLVSLWRVACDELPV